MNIVQPPRHKDTKKEESISSRELNSNLSVLVAEGVKYRA